MKKKTGTRYYIKWSSVHCTPPYYQLEAYQKTLRATPEAWNVRSANQFGWSNQPQVATFTAVEDNLPRIEEALTAAHEEFAIWGPIIYDRAGDSSSY